MSDETIESFPCFGGRCSVHVTGAGAGRDAAEAAALARRMLLAWHGRFSRFSRDSELSRLNADPRASIAVSPLMARLVEAALTAGAISAGLVDATLVHELERAGYVGDLGSPLELAAALRLAPPRRRGSPAARSRLREIALERCTLTRPPGVALDSGGLAKGLVADVLAEQLAGHAAFAVDCGGDLAIGGAARVEREVNVESPFDGGTLHTFRLRRGGVATSGIGRRSWLGRDGRPAHHLLDPATGRPAFTGVVQATALAPTALLAEIHAKAAVLSGPLHAPRRLPHGGVIVLDDGSHRLIAPPPTLTPSDLSAYMRPRPSRGRKAA